MKYYVIEDVDNGLLDHSFYTREDAQSFLMDVIDNQTENLEFYEIIEKECPAYSGPKWFTVKHEAEPIKVTEVSAANDESKPWVLDYALTEETLRRKAYFDTEFEAFEVMHAMADSGQIEEARIYSQDSE